MILIDDTIDDTNNDDHYKIATATTLTILTTTTTTTTKMTPHRDGRTFWIAAGNVKSSVCLEYSSNQTFSGSFKAPSPPPHHHHHHHHPPHNHHHHHLSSLLYSHSSFLHHHHLSIHVPLMLCLASECPHPEWWLILSSCFRSHWEFPFRGKVVYNFMNMQIDSTRRVYVLRC